MMPRAVLREISESQNPEAVALILAEPLHRSLRHTSNLLPVTFLSVVPRSSIGGAASLLPKDHYQDGKHHRRQHQDHGEQADHILVDAHDNT